MKKNFPLDKAYRLLNHGPVVLISSTLDGKNNIMPIAWQSPVDLDPTRLALIIGDHSHTFKVVGKTKELVVNLPTVELVDKVFSCGKCHGHEVDKFRKFNLTPEKASKVKAPLIGECVANLECKVVDDKMMDTHNIFIVEVVAAWVEEGAYDEFLRVDKPNVKTLHHLGADVFTVPAEIIRAKKINV
ncbi:MAG: flavin reductase family protein [Candidatus Margulisbacteria bacterium]|nr:flavin reductase family protein [Candidatus Margulisiibacteriota bacterium]MBU1021146.1 flavin reductase family protein [Candidatus Margulisiibacteriota bacterium]MBU1729752.1 flavin reductase family protein [Candidatus Margulisiibacteriota bacterium]MBU1955253.1 flavin reductase family protein [Candidatus Margulisiibacteriota bacterium]